jgi:hypothetical protein
LYWALYLLEFDEFGSHSTSWIGYNGTCFAVKSAEDLAAETPSQEILTIDGVCPDLHEGGELDILYDFLGVYESPGGGLLESLEVG